MLIRHLLPDTRRHIGANWELAPDNAPVHKARAVMNYLDNQGVQMMECTAYPRDMNPIKHLRNQLVSAVEAQHPH